MTICFPRPYCATCGQQQDCQAAGCVLPTYPDCRRPLLGTRLERMRELLQFLERREGRSRPALGAMSDALLQRFAIDRNRFSEIFEPSWSWDDAGAHAYRLSYAFPAFRREPDAVGRAMLALTAPFGSATSEACRRVLRAARHPAVEQPLFGLADDGDEGLRVKLYLQFRADASAAEVLPLARAVLGCSALPGESSEGALHLLGLDLGDSGLRGAKVYWARERLEHADAARLLGPGRWPASLPQLRDVLLIHRLTGPDGAGAREASELHFGLADNGFVAGDLTTSPLFAELPRFSDDLAELEAAFRIGLRRATLGLRGKRKLTLYYVLAETEREVRHLSTASPD